MVSAKHILQAILLPLVAAAGLSSCSGKGEQTAEKVAVKVEITLQPYVDQTGVFHSPVWNAQDVVSLTDKTTGERSTAMPAMPGSATSGFVFSMSQPAKGDVLSAAFPVVQPEFTGEISYTQKISGEQLTLVNIKNKDLKLIDDENYPMLLVDQADLATGVKYEKYKLTKQSKLEGKDAFVHIVTADMTRPGLVLEAAFANEICPNPSTIDNNNGKRLREILTENVERRAAQGHKIIAGINGDYYETLPGFPLSCHVDNGEAVFINSEEERRVHSNFLYGVTMFEDHTLSTEARTVACSVRYNGKETVVSSVNDTIVRLSPTAPSRVKSIRTANVYTHRFVRVPFPKDEPNLLNRIGTQALFIVAKADDVLKVNKGYSESRITAVYDGISGSLNQAPYVSAKGEWVLQLTGDAAKDFAGAKVGDKIEFKADIAIAGKIKPIYSLIGGKYRFIVKGKPSTGYEDPRSATRHTMVALNEAGTEIRLITIEWTSMFRDAGNIAMVLGAYNVVKFDGGGSTCMWINRFNGQLVQKSTDSRGPQRSNMNYLHLRQL